MPFPSLNGGKMTIEEKLKLLHIYGQGYWHDEVRIIGNREALLELRETIAEALYGNPYFMETFAVDGEGYTITVRLVEGGFDSPEWDAMPLPYSEDFAQGKED